MEEYLNIIQEYTLLLKNFLDQQPSEFISSLKHKLPSDSGVYGIFENKSGKALYIGESKNICKRVWDDFFQANESRHTAKKKIITEFKLHNLAEARDYLRKNCNVKYYIVDENRRKKIEHLLISILNPKWND
jgi:excinuclease UvrABC nuclease subunit